MNKEISETRKELTDKDIDDVETLILENLVLVDMPVKHTFTPNLYSREIFMPAGVVLTSKVHKTEHPFIVLSGRVLVRMPDGNTEAFETGHHGITKPGTRRVLFIEEDCRWITFHTLSKKEEKARREGMETDDLLTLIENRIIEAPKLANPEDKSANEIYKEKLLEQESLYLPEGGEE